MQVDVISAKIRYDRKYKKITSADHACLVAAGFFECYFIFKEQNSETISIIHYVEGWTLISTLEFIVKSTLQKKKVTILRSQELYWKRVVKYILRKLSSATKCVITWKV